MNGGRMRNLLIFALFSIAACGVSPLVELDSGQPEYLEECQVPWDSGLAVRFCGEDTAECWLADGLGRPTVELVGCAVDGHVCGARCF